MTLHLEARCRRDLGQEHGAELAGADQARAHGLSLGPRAWSIEYRSLSPPRLSTEALDEKRAAKSMLLVAGRLSSVRPVAPQRGDLDLDLHLGLVQPAHGHGGGGPDVAEDLAKNRKDVTT